MRKAAKYIKFASGRVKSSRKKRSDIIYEALLIKYDAKRPFTAALNGGRFNFSNIINIHQWLTFYS
jgi:hypothetical protein